MLQTFKNIKRYQIVLAALVLVAANLAFVSGAAAASLTQTTVAETNMLTSGTSQAALGFKTSASGSGTTLTATFTGWTGSGGTGTVLSGAITVTNGCALFSGMSGAPLPTSTSITAAGTSASGLVTFSGLTTLAPSTAYCVTLSSANALTNPTAAGVGTVNIVAGSDSSVAAIDFISNDQYTVSATVAPTFTMSLPSTTDSLGTLSSSAITSSTGVTATVSTNAAAGWFLWARDSRAGLYSATQGNTIGTVAPGSNASLTCSGACTEKYALGVVSGGATPNYADAGGSTGGGLSTTTFNEIATGGAPTNANAVAIKELATVAPTTPAASDYTDVITIVGAGSF